MKGYGTVVRTDNKGFIKDCYRDIQKPLRFDNTPAAHAPTKNKLTDTKKKLN